MLAVLILSLEKIKSIIIIIIIWKFCRTTPEYLIFQGAKPQALALIFSFPAMPALTSLLASSFPPLPPQSRPWPPLHCFVECLVGLFQAAGLEGL